MIIGVDKNQLIGNHGMSNRRKHLQMEQAGAELLPLRLPFGDYIEVNYVIRQIIEERGGIENVHKKDLIGAIKLSIDTKKNLQEVVGNVCSRQHERFKRELLKPLSQNDAKLVLLIEEPEIKCLEDVYWWDNPRLKENPKATKGTSLYKSLCTIRDEYNVDIQFCSRADTGKRIIEILTKGGSRTDG